MRVLVSTLGAAAIIALSSPASAQAPAPVAPPPASAPPAPPASAPPASAPAFTPAPATPAAPAASPPSAPAVDPLPTEGPGIVVAPPLHIEPNDAQRFHKDLTDALIAIFGPRVMKSGAVVDAQLKSGIVGFDLASADGVARLAKATSTERAIIVEVTPEKVFANIYGEVTAAPTHILEIERGPTLDKKLATKLAALILERAKKTLGPRDELAFEIDLGLATVVSEPPPVDENAQWNPDIQEEIRREDARLAALRAERDRPRAASAMVAIGGGGGVRRLGVSGSFANALVPIANGVVPSASIYAAVSPLRFVPAWNHSGFADLVVDGHFRRGLGSARFKGAACDLQDDDLALRASYRAPLGEDAWMPRLGGGLGGGYERVEFSCSLPVVSTRYPYLDLHARAHQQLWPDLLDLDALLALRQVFVGAGESVRFPGWQAELFLIARPIPYTFARAGTRISGASVARGTALVVDDLRAIFELELGVAF